jgi:hypothetical protein
MQTLLQAAGIKPQFVEYRFKHGYHVHGGNKAALQRAADCCYSVLRGQQKRRRSPELIKLWTAAPCLSGPCVLTGKAVYMVNKHATLESIL